MRFWNENHRRDRTCITLRQIQTGNGYRLGGFQAKRAACRIRPSGLQGYSLTPTSDLICNAPVCRTFIEKSKSSRGEDECRVRNLLPPIRIERQSVLCKQKNRQNGIWIDGSGSAGSPHLPCLRRSGSGGNFYRVRHEPYCYPPK